MKPTIIPVLFLTSLILFSCSGENGNKADLIIFNGTIQTLDDNNPLAEAVAVNGDTIYSVGTNDEILKLKSKTTKIIDLKGKYLTPGFIDSHAHLIGLGKSKSELDLKNVDNWDEIIFMCADAAAEKLPGDWILGRGWHQEKWDPVPNPNINGYPVHKVLSSAVPNNPVLLVHASGHEVFANKKAMDIAGITKETPDPVGGIIVRDEDGNPTGLFKENAADIITKAYDKYYSKLPQQERKRELAGYIESAEKECISKGITSFHDAGSTFEEINTFKELADSGKLKIRLNVMILENNPGLRRKIADYRLIGYGNNFLTVRSIKKYMDGALGSRGAWLLEPYSDMPDSFGLNVTPVSEIEKTAEIAIENDFQLCVHSIGDRANRETLDLYERVFKNHPDKKNLRWRIEHAQHLSGEDIGRFAKLGVIPVMQTVHCTSDAVFVEKRLGHERALEGAYVWRKLINSGSAIANGTDAPVEDIDPIRNFYAAVTRRTSSGNQFFPGQCMTRLEALQSYTVNGAFAAFEENLKGRIKPGMLADFTVFSNNLLKIPESELLNTRVIYTIIGGKVVYSAEE